MIYVDGSQYTNTDYIKRVILTLEVRVSSVCCINESIHANGE